MGLLSATCVLGATFVAAAGVGPPPQLQSLTDLAWADPEALLEEIRRSPLRAAAREVALPTAAATNGSTLPTVAAHGMGDSCFEPGMRSIAKGIGRRTGSYAVCIPTGNSITDTINGYLMTMDKNVDVFAANIRKDPLLKGGFNAIGFSQGNNIIRGYIQRYNDPPVNAWISVHGTVMGVAALPSCFKQGAPLGMICRAAAEVLGNLAYSPPVQGILFQADYFRDPMKASSQAYLRNSELARWNNENPANANETYAANFAKTRRFAMVKAVRDSMVYPNEGQWWGSLADGVYGKVLSMRDTKFYQENLFGLKTADAAGKISFESTSGNHLEFTDNELYAWVEKYFLEGAAAAGLSVLI